MGRPRNLAPTGIRSQECSESIPNKISRPIYLYVCVYVYTVYEDESIINRNAVAFVFLLAALSISCASLGVVFFLS